MFSALDGSSPDVVAREKEIAELASKEEALAAAKKGPKMGDWELRLWVSLAVVVVTVRRLAFALFPEVGSFALSLPHFYGTADLQFRVLEGPVTYQA